MGGWVGTKAHWRGSWDWKHNIMSGQPTTSRPTEGSPALAFPPPKPPAEGGPGGPDDSGVWWENSVHRTEAWGGSKTREPPGGALGTWEEHPPQQAPYPTGQSLHPLTQRLRRSDRLVTFLLPSEAAPAETCHSPVSSLKEWLKEVLPTERKWKRGYSRKKEGNVRQKRRYTLLLMSVLKYVLGLKLKFYLHLILKTMIFKSEGSKG